MATTFDVIAGDCSDVWFADLLERATRWVNDAVTEMGGRSGSLLSLKPSMVTAKPEVIGTLRKSGLIRHMSDTALRAWQGEWVPLLHEYISWHDTCLFKVLRIRGLSGFAISARVTRAQ